MQDDTARDHTGPRGLFVTVEGGDGAGKSTLIAALRTHAEQARIPVVTTREPGGTALGERVRALLLESEQPPAAETELLLFCAARAQLVAEVIRPALNRGALVLCDRFSDSTVAYQHSGRGLSRAEVDGANAAATGGLRPDRTLLLDLDPLVGRSRSGVAADYLERESGEFHQRVRRGFLAIAAAEPERVVVLDAGLPAADLAATAWQAIAAMLPDAET